MNKKIFNEDSLKNLSTPEEMNKRVKVIPAAIWIMAVAIILFIVGFIAFSSFVTIDQQVSVAVFVNDGKATAYIREKDTGEVLVGCKLTYNGYNDIDMIEYINCEKPVIISTVEYGDYALSLGGYQDGEYLYEASGKTNMKSGLYQGYITTKSVSPLSYFFN